MMRFLSFLLLLLWYNQSLRAQNLIPQFEFIKNYGGSGGDGEDGMGGFHFTQDGYILYAGSSNSIDHDLTCNTPVSEKGWLVKTDKQGNLIFSNCFGGALESDANTQGYEYFTDMVTTRDSGCIAACFTTSAFSTAAYVLPAIPFPYACDDSVDGYKVLSLVKYDKNGNVQWFQCYGGGQDDGIMSIDNTSDGGYIFLAQVRSTAGQVGFHYGSIFAPDCWLVKTDSAGNIQWKEILGGTGDDYANKVREISPGRYMTSISTSSTDGNLTNVTHYSNQDAWFCLFDSAGNIIKGATIPWYGNGMTMYDFIVTNDGGIICAGDASGNGSTSNTCNASTNGDFAIFKMDSTFQIQGCDIQYGSGGNLYSITALSNSTFLACGNSEATAYNSACTVDTVQNWQGWMICTNMNGHVLWRKSICGSMYTGLNYSLFDTTTGSIYVSGNGAATDGVLTGVPNYGESDEWLFKVDLVDGLVPVYESNPITVYPNPVEGDLQITLPIADDGKITLMDITGETILTINTSGNSKETLHLATLATGLYILLYQDAHISVSKKILKD